MSLGPTRARQPFALFFRAQGSKVYVACAGVTFVNMAVDMDLGVLRLSPHEAFWRDGFPVVPVEDFEHVHEGMDVGICGFPLGNALFKQLGTMSSSFTRGILSSIIPAAGIERKHVTGFQLDSRATHGNSGGPVFSWSTGRMLGVLQGGLKDSYGSPLFTHAESIYKVLDSKMIDVALRNSVIPFIATAAGQQPSR